MCVYSIMCIYIYIYIHTCIYIYICMALSSRGQAVRLFGEVAGAAVACRRFNRNMSHIMIKQNDTDEIKNIKHDNNKLHEITITIQRLVTAALATPAKYHELGPH